MNTRREFLIKTPIALLTVAAGCRPSSTSGGEGAAASQATPGAPTTFATASGTGPEVSAATFEAAGKLLQVTLTPAERALAAESWRASMAPYLERRTGPRKVEIKDTDAPATIWNPSLPGLPAAPARDRFERSAADKAPLPAKDDDIAFAPVTQLSRWIESRALTSTRLTNIYLERIARPSSS